MINNKILVIIEIPVINFFNVTAYRSDIEK
jgi:hypothetical protein